MLKKIKILILISYFLTVASYFIPYHDKDPYLAVYEDDFLATVHQYCSDDQFYSNPRQETLKIADLGNNIQIAYCSYNLVFSHFTVTYNTRFWDTSDEDERFSSLWHEFFHCYFHLGHSEDPHNFMYAYENGLKKQEVKAQAEELLKNLCSKH